MIWELSLFASKELSQGLAQLTSICSIQLNRALQSESFLLNIDDIELFSVILDE